MIVWHKVTEQMPEDNQMCWIVGDADMILGPFPYKAPHGWMDILATSEAGAIYSKDNGVTYWTEENSINVPED